MTDHEPAPEPLDGKPVRPRIVVVGGGAAGLELVTRLGDRLGKGGLADIALVERSRTHLWKPLLHMVAAGSMDPTEHQLNYLAQGHWHHFRYHYGDMVGLDRAGKSVEIGATFDEEGKEIAPARSVPYDILVIAIGSVTNDFGTPGVSEHAIPLETPEQAERFHHRLLNAFLRAQSQAEPIHAGQLHIAIIGAGATGTELAAKLHETANALIAYGLDNVDRKRDIRIVLIEAAPRSSRRCPSGSPTPRSISWRRSTSTSAPTPRSRRCGPTGSSSPAANSFPPSSWSGRRASRGPRFCAISTGWRSIGRTSS